MDDTPFRLRGYPESNTEKLLLTVISRYVERRAWQVGRGTLRSSFQRLSRIDDERGTRTVYETIADTGVQTHVYGVPDWQPPAEFGAVTHGGHTEAFQKSWFVVYTPPEDDDCAETGLNDPHVALLALEVAPRVWKGFWTFRPGLVEAIDAHVAANL
jgi:DICT domain-containing protein